MSQKLFTQSEMEILLQNPFTADVCPSCLYYTLDFKKFVLKEAEKGETSVKIFARAGYDPEMLGKPRIYAAMKAFKRESASEQGLHESRHSREAKLEALAKEDLTKKKTDKAISELQKRVIHLEQEISFLKKLQSLEKSPPQE